MKKCNLVFCILFYNYENISKHSEWMHVKIILFVENFVYICLIMFNYQEIKLLVTNGEVNILFKWFFFSSKWM